MITESVACRGCRKDVAAAVAEFEADLWSPV